MGEEQFYEVGPHSEIDPDVILGYKYPGCREKTRIGERAIVKSGTIIYADVTIGRRFTCGHHALIRPETTIGDRVVVYHKCTLEGRITIGSGVKIMAHVYIPSTTRIGEMVFIGPGTTFLNDKFPMRRRAPVAGAVIEEHVTIGGGCTICPGVRIGAYSFIGAGAVVNKDVPERTLAYGVPARHYPLPEELAGGNLAELLLPQTDIWGAQRDESWREELDRFGGDR
ncbi:MAG: N-acetyltransferase [Phycisphaerae bacterium]|nr:N-acetyltransferase [Phycisphaerae bacterium]